MDESAGAGDLRPSHCRRDLSGSLVPTDAIRLSTYDFFLIVVYCDYIAISYRFRDSPINTSLAQLFPVSAIVPQLG